MALSGLSATLGSIVSFLPCFLEKLWVFKMSVNMIVSLLASPGIISFKYSFPVLSPDYAENRAPKF